MRVKHEELQVRISRRTLWVGRKAYPLQHITRVEPIEIKIRRWEMAKTYLRQGGGWLGVGFVGLLVLSCLGNAVPPSATWACLLATFAGLVVITVRLIRGLTLPTLHGLCIGTADAAQRALVSTRQALIEDLADRVVNAIDNPALEFALTVDHIDIQYGNRYGGDHIQNGDKVVNT